MNWKEYARDITTDVTNSLASHPFQHTASASVTAASAATYKAAEPVVNSGIDLATVGILSGIAVSGVLFINAILKGFLERRLIRAQIENIEKENTDGDG